MKGRLLALSSAAVLAVYTAGYARTRSAAELLEAEERRPPMPRPGSIDRAPIPATPDDPKLVAVPGAQAPAQAAAQARGTITEDIDRSRRNPEATPEKRAVRALADLAAKAVESPRESAPIAGVASSPATAPAPIASAPVAVAQANAEGSALGAIAAPPPAVAAAAALPAPSETPQIPAAPAMPKWKDGRYTGWGTSRHGDLQASVMIENGRISTASISQCLTRYPCDWISKLPPQVVQRQSAEVDYVSGATESATAFYYAVIQALSKAAGQ